VNAYSLTVTVSDGTASVTSPVSISVTNGNDPPVFVNAPYNVSVNENDISATVYTVSAIDEDAGKFDSLLFFMVFAQTLIGVNV
jgi:hypothetical protein